jgi:hypothetical protein
VTAAFASFALALLLQAESTRDEGSPPPAPPPPDSLTPEEGRLVLDISAAGPPTPAQVIAAQACEAEQDAARLRGEIIVCRKLEDAAGVSGFDKEDWERRYAQRTQGMKTPDVAGEGIFRGPASIGGLCFIPPCPRDPALIIDVEALPEAPAGSDADRIARGLPPLGGGEER